MLTSFHTYRRLISIKIRGQLQYRTAFLFDVLATAFITTVEFGSLALILQRFENIAGWTLAEVAFLYGLIAVAFGTMDMLFSGFDPQSFGQHNCGKLRNFRPKAYVVSTKISLLCAPRFRQGTVTLSGAKDLWAQLEILCSFQSPRMTN